MRKFCSRCGNSLANAASVGAPWWKRILPNRRAKVLPAGERPHHRGGVAAPRVPIGGVFRFVRTILLIVVAVIGVAYGANIAGVRDTVNSQVAAWKNAIIPSYNPVHASGATASSSIPGHPAGNAIDGFKNTYWAANLNSDPQPSLILTFSSSVNVDQMLFTSGDSDNFLAEPRPRLLHLVFSNGNAQDFTLHDSKDPQQFDIHDAHGVTRIEIHIETTYPDSEGGNDVSLTLVETFARQL